MRDLLTSPRMEDMKRKRNAYVLRLSILITILVISIISALAYFSNDRRMTVHTVEVKGTRIINVSDIEQAVKEDLFGKYVYIFARANTLIYPHDKIQRELVRDFPRIETINVSRVGWNKIRVSITERAGEFLYCGSQIPEQENNKGENCYFVNNEGYIFDKAPYFSGDIYFKYYLSLPNDAQTQLGVNMLAPDRFHEMTRFVDKITLLGFKPVYIVMANDGTNSLYLGRGLNNVNPKIIFKDDNDLSKILENIATAMRKPEFAKEINSKYDKLLYIDLRFNNKVLYKFNE